MEYPYLAEVCPWFKNPAKQIHAVTSYSMAVTVTVNCEVSNQCLLFSHAEYSDTHIMYGFCNGNAHASVEYHRHFPEWRILSTGVFSCVHQTMHETGCLPSICVHSEMEVVPDINKQENILEMPQRSPQNSSHNGVSCMQAWQNLHKDNLQPYQIWSVQHLQWGDIALCMDNSHWITAHSQQLSVISFTAEESFSQDGINKSQMSPCTYTSNKRNPLQKEIFSECMVLFAL